MLCWVNCFTADKYKHHFLSRVSKDHEIPSMLIGISHFAPVAMSLSKCSKSLSVKGSILFHDQKFGNGVLTTPVIAPSLECYVNGG